ncbi:hypothetical protein B0H14DRAFT_2635166 [Mycena olivaceomarginata]|nr:hypothetical protein B0H14DRAFT_2635166 [Mycena olivaceomarginata]
MSMFLRNPAFQNAVSSVARRAVEVSNLQTFAVVQQMVKKLETINKNSEEYIAIQMAAFVRSAAESAAAFAAMGQLTMMMGSRGRPTTPSIHPSMHQFQLRLQKSHLPRRRNRWHARQRLETQLRAATEKMVHLEGRERSDRGGGSGMRRMLRLMSARSASTRLPEVEAQLQATRGIGEGADRYACDKDKCVGAEFRCGMGKGHRG